MCFAVCVLHAICGTIGPHTHAELEIGASQLSRLLTVEISCVYACAFAGVCVCECVSVCGGVRRLLPTHVSNTKPSNCPHDQREEDQPGRNRLMDRDWARINEKESGRSTAV